MFLDALMVVDKIGVVFSYLYYSISGDFLHYFSSASIEKVPHRHRQCHLAVASYGNIIGFSLFAFRHLKDILPSMEDFNKFILC